MPVLAIGAALGWLLSFFFDPQSGRRRRRLAADRTAGFVRHRAHDADRLRRAARAEAYGVAMKVTHLRERPKEFTDETLKAKVESELFRPADAPKGSVDVSVEHGVVQLRGEVEGPELIEELVARARKIPGVREVESLLHLPGAPARMHEAHQPN